MRLPEFDYSSPGAYFVTIVIHNRECLLGRIVDDRCDLSEFGRATEKMWLTLSSRYPHVELGTFCIMPNHVHGILVINDMEGQACQPLSEVVRGFKSSSGKWINQTRGTPGLPVWQRGYYDHVIRNDRDYQAIHEYILANPLNWTKDELGS